MTNKLRTLIAAAVGLLSVGLVQAQNMQDGAWRGSAGLSTTFNSGNSSNRTIAGTAKLTRATRADKASVYGNIMTAKSDSGTTADNWLLGAQYDYNIDADLYGFGTLNFEGDKIRNLKMRKNLGFGVGYHVISTPVTTFDVFGGLAYTHDTYYTAQVMDGSSVGKYGALELMLGEESSHKLADGITATQKFVLYPSLKDRGEFRSTLDAGLTVAMSKALSLNVGLNNRYNSAVGAGWKKSDTSLLTGINYNIGY